MPELVPVPGFRGYFADRAGGIWSCWARGAGAQFGPVYAPHRLDQNFTGAGYLSVTLTRRRQHFSVSVHRIICRVFNGPAPRRRREIRHKDGDPTNNQAANVAWCSRRENCADREAHGTERRGEQSPRCKITEANVRMIRTSNKTATVIARRLGLSVSHVCNIRNGRAWSWLKIGKENK